MYVEKTDVTANRIDARVVDKPKKEVLLLEMSYSWMANTKQKEEDKTSKNAPLRWETRQQYPHYKIAQHNIIIDVLGGVLQKAVISSVLNIARSFKVLPA